MDYEEKVIYEAYAINVFYDVKIINSFVLMSEVLQEDFASYLYLFIKKYVNAVCKTCKYQWSEEKVDNMVNYLFDETKKKLRQSKSKKR